MKILALVIRIVKQFIHDKRSLGMMILAPMLILYMMSLVFNGSSYQPKIAVEQVPQSIVQQLKIQGASVTSYTNEEAANKELQDAKVDAVIRMKNGPIPDVELEGSDPTANRAVLSSLQTALTNLSPIPQKLKPTITYLHGSQTMSSFDNFGPVFIGYFVFFFVFILSGVAFLRERTSGTLERLLATPLQRWEIVVGYVIGFGIFAILQGALIAWFGIDVIGMMMVCSFWYVLMISLLLALSALTLGTFLSAFANTEFQVFQFIPLVIVPQIFFSGLFNVATMVDWMRWLGVVMPLTYGSDALRNIMIRGNGWSTIANDAYVLIGFSVFFMIANVLALKKHRRI